MKFFNILLVFAYLSYYMSCTSTTKMIPVSYSADKLDVSNNDRALEIVTNESQVYFFEENTYSFKNDTIIGQAFKNYAEQKKWIKIALYDISNISEGVSEIDLAKSTTTILVIAGVTILSIVLLVVLTGGGPKNLGPSNIGQTPN